MCFYHQNVITSPFNFRNMQQREEAHQCYMRSLPWEHPLGEQNDIRCTCFNSLKGLCTWVYNPESKWAYCECLRSSRGNICKHQIKVLMFVCPNIVEGTIVCYCSLLNGTLNGGLNRMFNPCPIFTPCSQ